tara:strand:+ start:181 stop:432 length:252 start_codon:yes stop_codon:yes gene_type:complete
MIADQSTVNLSFLIFFLNQEQLGSRCQMRTIVQVQPDWVRLVHPGGLRCCCEQLFKLSSGSGTGQHISIGCVKRTIVQGAPPD